MSKEVLCDAFRHPVSSLLFSHAPALTLHQSLRCPRFNTSPVVEIIGSIGAEDAATTFLLPRHCDLFRSFLDDVRSWQQNYPLQSHNRPAWPTEVCSMGSVKTLYSFDAKAVPLVVAFGAMVHAKVMRIARFYERTMEASCGAHLAPDTPIDDVDRQFRNPLASGGIYYRNGGSPISSLRPSRADEGNGPSSDLASDQHGCNKVVRMLLSSRALPALWYDTRVES